MDTVYDGVSTGLAFKSNIPVDLYSYFDWAIWGRGDRAQYAGGLIGDPNIFTQGNLATNLISLLPETANANTSQTGTMKPSVVVGADLTDITYTPSALMAYARVTASGLVEVALEAVMLDTGFTYQVKAPAGAWVALTNSAHSFYPVSGQAWQYRVVGPRGNTSNVVTVTVA